MLSAITAAFTTDHHRCDRRLAETERRLTARDWPAAGAATTALGAALEHHFPVEEEGVSYPMADGALPTRGAAIAARLTED